MLSWQQTDDHNNGETSENSHPMTRSP